MSTKEACGIPSLSQDARTHYYAHAYPHTYAHAQSQACAFHEHANDSCQQNARSIENICGAASTPIRIQEACGIPLQSGCTHALLYSRTCTHICTCARPSLLRLRTLFVPFGRDIGAKTKPKIRPTTPKWELRGPRTGQLITYSFNVVRERVPLELGRDVFCQC